MPVRLVKNAPPLARLSLEKKMREKAGVYRTPPSAPHGKKKFFAGLQDKGVAYKFLPAFHRIKKNGSTLLPLFPGNLSVQYGQLAGKKKKEDGQAAVMPHTGQVVPGLPRRAGWERL